jgi:hypothetical protein
VRLTPGRRPVPALVAALSLTALLAALLPATSATATPAPKPASNPGPTPEAGPSAQAGPRGPGLPSVAEAKAAEQALQAVQEALADPAPLTQEPDEDESGRDLTVLLRDLYFAKDALDGAQARAANRLLARPASDAHDCGPGDPGQGSDFCIHWVTSGRHAPPPADNDQNGIPDQVDRTRAAIGKSWRVIVADGGYRAPLRDTGGPDDRFDVYLSDLGASSLYGVCNPTPAAAGAAASVDATATFCELDNDYRPAQYPAQTPLKNLRVTAAHEFFHAVQFAYDALEDGWMLEGTAAWVEDEVYDNINDNRQYLSASPLISPGRPLDRTKAGLSIYGSWIWWRYLTETYPERAGTSLPIIMRQMWESAADPSGPVGVWSVPAVEAALADRGADLPSTFAAFAAGNRAPRQTYEEGAAYPRAPRSGITRLTKARRGSGPLALTLPHLSSSTHAFRQGSGIRGPWRLRVKVDMPQRETLPRAVVTVVRENGQRRLREIPLNAKGNGKRVVGFGNKVRVVELTLVNAGHDYTCNWGTGWACRGGKPLSDGRRTTFRAAAIR